jgi:hypothetical protein
LWQLQTQKQVTKTITTYERKNKYFKRIDKYFNEKRKGFLAGYHSTWKAKKRNEG